MAASKISFYVIDNQGAIAAGGNTLSANQAVKIENQESWAGIALYFRKDEPTPSGLYIDVSIQHGGLSFVSYIAPSTEILDDFTDGLITGNGLIVGTKTGMANDYDIFDASQILSNMDSLEYTGTISGNNTDIYITVGDMNYDVRHIEDTTKNADLWRVFSCFIQDGQTEEYIWNGEDADGVVRLYDDQADPPAMEEDFIGGFHGDEIMLDFKVFIDGIEYNSLNFSSKKYKEVKMYQTSTIYHATESGKGNIPAFTRHKMLLFNKDGYTVRNCWKALEDLKVIYAYFGMLPVRKFKSDGETVMNNGYTTDIDYSYKDNSTTTQANSAMRSAVFHTVFGDIGIKMNNVSGDIAKGNVVYTSSNPPREKCYLGPVIQSTIMPISISANDVLKADTTIYKA